MQSTADTTFPAIVDRHARQSVFYVNEDNPHFEFSGFQSDTKAVKYFF